MMREGSCSCGQLKVICEGEPSRVTICHCVECQRRTGSVMHVGARFGRNQITIIGESKDNRRISDAGDNVVFHFCPQCGSSVFFTISSVPEMIGVTVGSFADSTFPKPYVSIYSERKHPWVIIPEGCEIVR